MPPVAEVSRVLGVLAFVAGAGSVVLLLLRNHPVTAALRAHAAWAAAAVAATATAGSLWYSEVAGFVPCELCWYQRIVMYPLAVVLMMAAVRGDRAIRPYARVLAAIGLLISAWHVALQRVPSLSGASTCAADAPCTAIWVDAFGVFTIPTMAACGFLAVLVLTSVRIPGGTPTRSGATRAADRVPALTECSHGNQNLLHLLADPTRRRWPGRARGRARRRPAGRRWRPVR